MKIILPVLFAAFFLLSGCKNKSAEKGYITDSVKESIFEMEFKKYTDHIAFHNYEKISDTSFYLNPKDYYPEFGIQEIRKSGKTIVIFTDILWDENLRRTGFKILDTLYLNIENPERIITIGYCFEIDTNKTNIIAVVGKTKKLHPDEIYRSWKANPATGKIEEIEVDHLECWNENYED